MCANWNIIFEHSIMKFSEHPTVAKLINQIFTGRYLGQDSNVCYSHKIEVNKGEPIERRFGHLRKIIGDQRVYFYFFKRP